MQHSLALWLRTGISFSYHHADAAAASSTLHVAVALVRVCHLHVCGGGWHSTGHASYEPGSSQRALIALPSVCACTHIQHGVLIHVVSVPHDTLPRQLYFVIQEIRIPVYTELWRWHLLMPACVCDPCERCAAVSSSKAGRSGISLPHACLLLPFSTSNMQPCVCGGSLLRLLGALQVEVESLLPSWGVQIGMRASASSSCMCTSLPASLASRAASRAAHAESIIYICPSCIKVVYIIM